MLQSDSVAQLKATLCLRNVHEPSSTENNDAFVIRLEGATPVGEMGLDGRDPSR
jgi:hypothetical protein